MLVSRIYHLILNGSLALKLFNTVKLLLSVEPSFPGAPLLPGGPRLLQRQRLQFLSLRVAMTLDTNYLRGTLDETEEEQEIGR